MTKHLHLQDGEVIDTGDLNDPQHGIWGIRVVYTATGGVIRTVLGVD